jgi:hypothetical protein
MSRSSGTAPLSLSADQQHGEPPRIAIDVHAVGFEPVNQLVESPAEQQDPWDRLSHVQSNAEWIFTSAHHADRKPPARDEDLGTRNFVVPPFPVTRKVGISSFGLAPRVRVLDTDLRIGHLNGCIGTRDVGTRMECPDPEIPNHELSVHRPVDLIGTDHHRTAWHATSKPQGSG